MSTKPSPPKKDDKITSSSPKKNEKPPTSTSIITTRTQASFLNTRQLRNKDVSRRKISEFTKQLMTPMKEKSTKGSQNKSKKSPKDKKEKEEGKGKKKTVAVSKIILDVQKETKSRKRKMVTEDKAEVKAAKRPRSPERSLSVQELIEQCEEQSLSEEDFMAILTADSPVWWEQPPSHLYEEDAIFSSPEEQRNFQEISRSFKQNRTHSPKRELNDSITIPAGKQTDDRFMDKRSKLENLLGNIKHKLTDTHKEENTPKATRNKRKTQNIRHFIDKEKEEKESNAELKIKQEDEFEKTRKIKTQSESTSSSDDMFPGFQNDDILKDLENMDIPIENDDLQVSPSENQTEVQSETFLESNEANKTSDKTKNCENKLEINTQPFKKSTPLNDAIKIIFKATANNEKESGTDGEDAGSNPAYGCKIFRRHIYNKKEVLASDEKSNETKSDFTITSHVQVTITSSTPRSRKAINNTSLATNEKPATKSDTNIKIIDKNCDLDPKIDKKLDDGIKTYGDKGKLNKTEAFKGDKSKDGEIKKSKSNNLNKEQLLAVYKIITNDEYRQQYIETVKPESETTKTEEDFKVNLETLIEKGVTKTYSKLAPRNNTNDQSNVKHPEDKLLKVSETGAKDKQRISNGTVNCANQNNIQNVNVIKAKENKNTNDSSLEENKNKITNENPVDSNGNKIDLNKIMNQNELGIVKSKALNKDVNKPNENKISNLNKIDQNVNKSDDCGDLDNAEKERSLHIASDVKSVKYCLKCSSIFETVSCSYCAKKKCTDSIKTNHQASCKVNIV